MFYASLDDFAVTNKYSWR